MPARTAQPGNPPAAHTPDRIGREPSADRPANADDGPASLDQHHLDNRGRLDLDHHHLDQPTATRAEVDQLRAEVTRLAGTLQTTTAKPTRTTPHTDLTHLRDELTAIRADVTALAVELDRHSAHSAAEETPAGYPTPARLGTILATLRDRLDHTGQRLDHLDLDQEAHRRDPDELQADVDRAAAWEFAHQLQHALNANGVTAAQIATGIDRNIVQLATGIGPAWAKRQLDRAIEHGAMTSTTETGTDGKPLVIYRFDPIGKERRLAVKADQERSPTRHVSPAPTSTTTGTTTAR